MRGTEAQEKVQNVEKLGRCSLSFRRERPRKLHLWSGRRSRYTEKSGQCPDFITRLDFFHIIDIRWLEELRAVEHERKFSFAADDCLDALGLFARPSRAREEKTSCIVSSSPAPDISKVVGVHIDEL